MLCFSFEFILFFRKNIELLKWYSSATMHNPKHSKNLPMFYGALVAPDLWKFVRVWKCNRYYVIERKKNINKESKKIGARSVKYMQPKSWSY